MWTARQTLLVGVALPWKRLWADMQHKQQPLLQNCRYRFCGCCEAPAGLKFSVGSSSQHTATLALPVTSPQMSTLDTQPTHKDIYKPQPSHTYRPYLQLLPPTTHYIAPRHNTHMGTRAPHSHLPTSHPCTCHPHPAHLPRPARLTTLQISASTLAAALQRVQDSDDDEEDDLDDGPGAAAWRDADGMYDPGAEEASGLTAEDERALAAFMGAPGGPAPAEDGPTSLGDLVLGKLRERQREQGMTVLPE